MKNLNAIKKLGNELSKKDQSYIVGGATVHGMCNDGRSFTMRNVEVTSDGGIIGTPPCGRSGVAFAIYQ